MKIETRSRPPGSPKPPGSGRQKGSINKKSMVLIAKAAAMNCTPMEVVMMTIRRHLDDAKTEKDAAVQRSLLQTASTLALGVAPYIHPKLSAISHSGPDGGPQQMEHGLSPKALEMVEAIKRGLEQSS